LHKVLNYYYCHCYCHIYFHLILLSFQLHFSPHIHSNLYSSLFPLLRLASHSLFVCALKRFFFAYIGIEYFRELTLYMCYKFFLLLFCIFFIECTCYFDFGFISISISFPLFFIFKYFYKQKREFFFVSCFLWIFEFVLEGKRDWSYGFEWEGREFRLLDVDFLNSVLSFAQFSLNLKCCSFFWKIAQKFEKLHKTVKNLLKSSTKLSKSCPKCLKIAQTLEIYSKRFEVA